MDSKSSAWYDGSQITIGKLVSSFRYAGLVAQSFKIVCYAFRTAPRVPQQFQKHA